VAAFWAHQAWWQSGSGKDEGNDYRPMDQLGYAILDEIARLIVDSPAAAAPALWRPVFALGPKGHYAIGHFLTCWFSQITDATVVTDFAQRWRPMIDFMVSDEKWAKSGPWYYGQQLQRLVLGFGAADYFKRVRLTHEDNLVAFCGFLGTEAGKPLRLDGLHWITNAMKANPPILPNGWRTGHRAPSWNFWMCWSRNMRLI
jgi:hypothetical protein